MNVLLCSEELTGPRRAIALELTEHRCISCAPAEVMDHLGDADVVVPFATPIDEAKIAAGGFGLIQQFGVGIERINLGAATRAGVWVANVPAALYGNADSVAEHAVMLMLALSRRLNFVKGDIQQRLLGEPFGQSLLRKTCCLVGLGAIGTEIARRLQPFGMRLTAVRRRPAEPVYADLRLDRIHGTSELYEALADADYVVLSLPQTSATRNIMNAEALSRMKPGAFLVNVGRGSLIDPEALLTVLQSGHLAGAGLDVFWEEPVDPDHPVFRYNVIATPHVAGITDSSCHGIALAIAENVSRFEAGLPPKHAANQIGAARRRDPG